MRVYARVGVYVFAFTFVGMYVSRYVSMCVCAHGYVCMQVQRCRSVYAGREL